jgi:cytochrome c2
MAAFFIFEACNNAETATVQNETAQETAAPETTPPMPAENNEVVKPGDVKLTTPLVHDWVISGQGIYEIKCQACHKLSDERLVGPGWQGITSRREPHWIMNMITHTDYMLEKDTLAQKLLEQCLVRMPNQDLSKAEAREILEFMRNNDGVK